jgi:phosphomannomutase
LKNAGRTLLDALDDLARTHGLHTTDAVSLRVSDLSVIGSTMSRLRSGLPGSLAGEKVVDARDLQPLTDAIVIRTDSTRVVIRPSGTEPKLKCYLEIVDEPAGADADLIALRAAAADRMAGLRSAVGALIGA